MPSSDRMSFLRAWLAAPLRVASITPSSNSLAALITRDITCATGPVIELGPGTGVFTRALLERGVKEENLVLIEYEAEFARLLGARFPKARIYQMDAATLRDRYLFDGLLAGAIVSGLPFLSMPTKQVFNILDGVFQHLRPGGAMYQFTYGGRCPVAPPILEQLDLTAARVGRTFRNIPPATVYRLARQVQIEASAA